MFSATDITTEISDGTVSETGENNDEGSDSEDEGIVLILVCVWYRL